MPENIGRRKTFRSENFFRNECNFYSKVVPHFMDFQQKRNIVEPIAFTDVPRCYAVYCDGQNDFIAMEDLFIYGFATVNRQDGLNLEQCKLLITTLGKFHAVSMAIKDQEPERFNEIINSVEVNLYMHLLKMVYILNFSQETYYAEKFREWHEPFVKDQILVARDAISKEYGGTEYEAKMMNFTEFKPFCDTMIRLTHSKSNFSVIGHGDCWIPNFLIRYEDKVPFSPVETKLIDFQSTRYASPVLDVSFFIYSGTQQGLRENHYNELIKDYYMGVTDMLRALGSDPEKLFPWSGFQQELKEYGRFGVGVAMESLPFSIMDDEDTPDLDAIEGDQAVPVTNFLKIRPIPSKEGRLRLADVFKHAIDQGYLD